MRKILTKFIGMALVAGLIISTIPAPLSASPTTDSLVTEVTTSERLWGLTRYETALRIAEKFNCKNVDSIILASGTNFPDALAAGVLAKKVNAPILLLGPTVAASKEAFSYIKEHLIKDGSIYIVGGTGVIGPAFTESLNKIGYPKSQIIQIGGLSRYETSSQVAKAVNPPKEHL